jgi:hypothetical protein
MIWLTPYIFALVRSVVPYWEAKKAYESTALRF